MNQRGVTLLEVLIVGSVGAIVLLGIGSFYVSMVNSYERGGAQAFTQRQGTMIQEELARKILPAQSVLKGPCGGGLNDTDSLLVDILNGNFLCFYQESGIYECDIDDPAASTACAQGSVRNLLAGAPTRLQASDLTFAPRGGSSVDISFRLQDADGLLDLVSFGMHVTVRNK